MSKRIFLTVGGSDPSGGAGIQADIATALRIGVYPCSVITAITAQNTSAFLSVKSLDPKTFEAQIYSVLTDIRPDAVKIGMLCDCEIIEILSRAMTEFSLENIVIDPVVSPTLSGAGVGEEIISAMVSLLFPFACLVTPNIPELDIIERITGQELITQCEAYLFKGGHSAGKDINVTDRLFLKSGTQCETKITEKEFVHPRVETTNTHGSGCVLSSAIACYLALGNSLSTAVEHAINFLIEAMEKSKDFNPGKGKYGPLLI